MRILSAKTGFSSRAFLWFAEWEIGKRQLSIIAVLTTRHFVLFGKVRIYKKEAPGYQLASERSSLRLENPGFAAVSSQKTALENYLR